MNNEELCTLIKYYQIKEDEMGQAYNMHGRDQNCLESSDQKT